MRVVVSACLLGEHCKYDGGTNESAALVSALRYAGCEVIAVCPEVAGGLPVPRPRSEIRDGAVVNEFGVDVDEAFRRGADSELGRVLAGGPVDLAILQPRSPSCGVGEVYDGSFRGVLVAGDGVFARLLSDHGIPVLRPEDVSLLLSP